MMVAAQAKNPGLELAWSLAPGSAKHNGPKNWVTQQPTTQGIWKYCLSQFYTVDAQDTKLFYDTSTPCGNFSSDFWSNVTR